jgi:hypothetical protein
MKSYAAVALVALLLASAGYRQPAVSAITPTQRDALTRQVETLLRQAGYTTDKATQINGFPSLPHHAFRMPGCAHEALTLTLRFRELDFLRAGWARVASTFPDYRLSLHYDDGQWTELNRPAIAWKQIRLKFTNVLGTTTHEHDTALLVASHKSCDAPMVTWRDIWRPNHRGTLEAAGT